VTCYICGQQHFPTECYLAEADDFTPEVPTLPKVGPYKPSDEYLAWLASFEPKPRPDGRWEIAA